VTQTPVTPVTYTLPMAPASYSWEATDEEIAARYGVAPESIVRFDLNTSPAPPEIALRVLAAGRFEAPLSEYPPTDYRRLIETAAATYGVEPGELIVGAGADEILDICAKALLREGDRAVVPVPTYAMYRVVTEQRRATIVPVPRRPAADGWALDTDAIRRAAADAALVWLCDPNNPTGTQEPDGHIEQLLSDLAGDADAADRQPPMVVVDEAYFEFVSRSVAWLRHRHPNLIVVRTASKAYGLAGLRVGFGIATEGTMRRLAPFRPPGSLATTSVTVVREALADGTGLRENLARVDRERPRLAGALAALGWKVGPSVTNFLLVDIGTPDRAQRVAEGLLRRGLVPRTFPNGHPLAAALRVTVRTPDENDALVAAAAEIAAELDELPGAEQPGRARA